MKKTLHTTFKMRAAAVAVASGLCLTPLMAEAASLGKITVLSAMGQPLRAEIEVSAGRDELPGMVARLAAQGGGQAGGDFSPALADLRFALDKRPSGASVIRVTSVKPINEPFLNFFVELNWPSGRLVREYIFLLDPPEVAPRVTAKPVTAPQAKPLVTAKPVAEPRPVTARPVTTSEAPPKVAESTRTPAPKTTETSEGSGSHAVKPGDTLAKIARATMHDGVSLEQMLVGLYQANNDAFISGNVNRLKSGVILKVPEKEAVAAIPEAEARKVLQVQAADWNSYRQKLAGAVAQTPAKEDTATQASGGKITAKVEDKAAPAASAKDQVKVSRGDMDAKAKAAADEQLIAKNKALKEATERVAMLEKNIAELQKLVELKNKNLAELQKQAAERQITEGKKTAAETKRAEEMKKAEEAVRKAEEQRKAEEAKRAEEAKKAEELKKAEEARKAEEAKKAEEARLAEEAKKAEEAKQAEALKKADEAKKAEEARLAEEAKKAEEAKQADAAKPLDGAPADAAPQEEIKPEEPKPVEPPKPVEAPKPPPKPVAPPPPPPEEGFLDNPLMLGGLGALVAGLVGFLLFKRRRNLQGPASVVTEPLQSSLGPNSVFRNTGGQSVDTGGTTPQSTDFSQTGPGSIDTDEVDPVAEADVYMAYGRDTQAEEILLEALQKDPHRTAIHVKLLEIYANRKSVKQFETLASELYAQSGGVGGEWEKVAAMGAKLDPANPLYSANKAGDTAAFDADATMVVSPDNSLKATVTMPGALSQLAETAASEAAAMPDLDLTTSPMEATAVIDTSALPESLDFDLGGAPAAPAKAEDVTPFTDTVTKSVQSDSMDFDLGLSEPAAPAAEETSSLDFDLGLSTDTEGTAATAFSPDGTMVIDTNDQETAGQIDFGVAPAPQAVETAGGLDIDLGMGDSPAPLEEAAGEGVDFDVKLTDSAFLGLNVEETPEAPAPSFDMGAINLDLTTPDAGTASEPLPLASANADPQWEEANTKLDLAKAYEEMGDLEGARELLKEVVGEGPTELVEQARVILTRIGE